MDKKFFLIACLFGATAVMLGAMGSHILEKLLPASKIETFEIGVRYQFYHAVVLLLVSTFRRFFSKKWMNLIGWTFVVAILLFSGSLYFLAMSDLWGLNSLRPVFGPLTPIGGVFFILGWLTLFFAGWKEVQSEPKA